VKKSIFQSSKPDISPDYIWRIPMKKIVLAALAALSVGAGVANAQTYSHGSPAQHSAIYDNAGHGPQQTGMEGGGG
jgi:hypothetical protein